MKTDKHGKSKKTRQPEYDSAWKDIIEEHFEPFLEFFFPDIHRDIDFSRNPEILSRELRKIFPDAKTGKRYADILIKVYLNDGTPRYLCLFIQVEIQGSREIHFMERMFTYHYRIFDKYKDQGAKIVSLAILTDEKESYRPEEYCSEGWGFSLRMKVPIVKILDYKNKKELREKLENSANPMSMIVKAQLRSFAARIGDNKKKYSIKFELIRQLLKHGYDGKYIRSLFNFIDLVFRLPEGLEKKLSEEVSKIEEEHKMAYVTSWEKIAKKEGKREGKREGILETAKKMIKKGIDKETIIEITGFSREELEKLSQTSH
jgi:predicted transposase/invertase (TIGR01784 family)